MYAIVKAAGFQYRVEPGQVLQLPSLPVNVGQEVVLSEVLLAADGSAVRVGRPTLPGATVTAEVVRHGKGPKIVVFKFKRRKNYARKRGHRQKFTEVRIKEIRLGSEEGAGDGA